MIRINNMYWPFLRCVFDSWGLHKDWKQQTKKIKKKKWTNKRKEKKNKVKKKEHGNEQSILHPIESWVRDDAVEGYVVLEFNNHSCDVFFREWNNLRSLIGLMVGWRTSLTATRTFVLDRWLLWSVWMQRGKLRRRRPRNRQVGIWRWRTSSWRCCLSVTRSRLRHTKSCFCDCLRLDDGNRRVVSQ